MNCILATNRENSVLLESYTLIPSYKKCCQAQSSIKSVLRGRAIYAWREIARFGYLTVPRRHCACACIASPKRLDNLVLGVSVPVSSGRDVSNWPRSDPESANHDVAARIYAFYGMQLQTARYSAMNRFPEFACLSPQFSLP